MNAARSVLCACVVTLIPLTLPSQPLSDDAQLVDLLRRAARETARQVHASPVLKLIPKDAPVMITQVFSEELAERGHRMFLDEGKSQTKLILHARALNSSTAALPNSSYLRTSSMDIGVHIEDQAGGAVLWSKTFTQSLTDTIPGNPPYSFRDYLAPASSSFWEDWIVPIVSGVAAIIIVVLLFTVRES